MKKLLVLALLLAGCGGQPSQAPAETGTPVTPTATATPSPVVTGTPAPTTQVKPEDFPVNFYPGSKVLGSGRLQFSQSEGPVCTVDLETGDKPEKVVAFYKKELPKAQHKLIRDGTHVGVMLVTPKVEVSVAGKGAGSLINIVSNP